jgi:hypothetical protein
MSTSTAPARRKEGICWTEHSAVRHAAYPASLLPLPCRTLPGAKFPLLTGLNRAGE